MKLLLNRYFQFALLLLCALCCIAQTSDEIDLAPKGVMKNKLLQVSVNSRTGRIVYFGKVSPGHHNLLWLNPAPTADKYDWVNWGGDRLWATQQAGFRYVYQNDLRPDRALDQRPWQVTIDPEQQYTQMQSSLSLPLGISAKRILSWGDISGELVIDNQLKREVASPFPVHVWSITQLCPAPLVFVDCPRKRPVPNRDWLNLGKDAALQKQTVEKIGDEILAIHTRQINSPAKIGFFGHWMAAVYPKYVLIQASQFAMSGAYPDGSNLQLYIEPKYIELETLSENRMLQLGETLSHRVRWYLIDKTEDEKTHDLIKRIRSILYEVR